MLKSDNNAVDSVDFSAARAVDLASAGGTLVEWRLDDHGNLSAKGPVDVVLGCSAERSLDALRVLLDPIVEVVRAGAGWEDYELEQTHIADDASTRELVARAHRLRDGSAVVGVLLDATDRSATADRLVELLERYRLLVELSPDMVVVHERGLLRYVNPIGVKMLGYASTDDMVGRPILDFVQAGSVPRLMERIAGLEVPGAVSEAAEIVLIGRDGTTTSFESTSVRTTWEGRPAFQVFLRDQSARRRAEEAIRYQASLVASVSDAIVATDLVGRVESWNPAAERLYQRSMASAIGLPLAELLGDEAITAAGGVRPGGVSHRRADETVVPVHVSVSPIRREDGEVSGYVAVCADQTEKMRAAADRLQAEARFTAVVATLEEGIVVVEADGTISAVNSASTRLLGPGMRVGANGWRALRALHLVGPDGQRIRVNQHPVTVAFRTGENQRDVTMGFEDADGGLRWVSLNCQVLTQGTLARSVVCSFSDITHRRAAQERLAHDATHDSLTGLLNRRGLLEVLDEQLSPRQGPHQPVAVLFVDVDRFKTVNDGHGHPTGDHVLTVLGTRLQTASTSVGSVARLAGDEFVVVTTGLETGEVLHLAEDLRTSVAQTIPLPHRRDVSVTASVGVVFAQPEQDAESVLRDADLAMYEAKQQGRARVETFNAHLRAAAVRRVDLASRLRRALDNDQLTVAYQPIFRVSDGTVEGAEALARWDVPGLGPVSPAEFVPIAEEHGLVVELGRAIMRTACHDAAKTEGLTIHPHKLSVNLSTRQLNDPGLIDDLIGSCSDSGLDPDRLWFEVTESVLMQSIANGEVTLNRLREVGAHLAIDDFGTGYSSLAYLRRLPVEVLKIDQSFVAAIGSPEDDAIVAAIVDLAHTLGRTVVAEGVETAYQLGRLVAIGCDAVQGFLMARPAASWQAAIGHAALLPVVPIGGAVAQRRIDPAISPKPSLRPPRVASSR